MLNKFLYLLPKDPIPDARKQNIAPGSEYKLILVRIRNTAVSTKSILNAEGIALSSALIIISCFSNEFTNLCGLNVLWFIFYRIYVLVAFKQAVINKSYLGSYWFIIFGVHSIREVSDSGGIKWCDRQERRTVPVSNLFFVFSRQWRLTQ